MNRFFKYPVIKRSSTSGKSGFSIIELLVVLAVVALLVTLAIPAMNAMQKSLGSGGAESMISTALATARTLAIKNGHYAGVRFQKAWYRPSSDPAVVPPYDNLSKADQYMIFITFDKNGRTNWDCGFLAVEGYKPIKLPDNIGVFDMMRRRERASRTCNDSQGYNEDQLKATDFDNVAANLDPTTEPYLEQDNINIRDTSTFSIIFSPAGKLVTMEVRCGNYMGASNCNRPTPTNPAGFITPSGSNDKVFNSYYDIATGNGQFLQDDYDEFGVGVEHSKTSFVIYEREKFEKMATSADKMKYITGLKTMNINPYTGEIIK